MSFRRLVKAKVVALSCALSLGAMVCSSAKPDEPHQADSADRDYSADLKRFPPIPAQRALATFEVEPGFKLQLAAAEPLVTDPVAMEFDEYGRLYVVEMLGYSEDAEDMLGRIRLLEDADRDGVFETSTVFADGLGWPTAVICYDGGIFVGAAPDILYFKDTDGDRRADERGVVFTGFGTDNVQGLLNSFRWGLDNRIHVAVSRNGAELRRGEQPNAEPLVLRGRNFAFDPKTLEFEATSGASQHGFSFDHWGSAFTCHNSDHIQQVMYDDRDMSRNAYLRPPAALKSIAVEGPAADVYRISPIEPWREIRTRLRVKGIVEGVVEGGGRAGGYFTSATGVTIYDGDAWPKEFYGNAFIGDVGSNLVHRKLLARRADSLAYVAKRATPNREFVASRDTWFRPVQFANGPDGNLYALDMYREVIEHPASLPPVLKKHLDLTSGRDRGRIYRVVRADANPEELRQQLSRELPGMASPSALVAMLSHKNGWHRITAARLLYERNDSKMAADLRELLQSDIGAPAQLSALYLLSDVRGLDLGTLKDALSNSDPHVRAHAVRLARTRLPEFWQDSNSSAEKLEDLVLARTMDSDRLVRFQTALALGDLRAPSRIGALTTIVRRDGNDEYMRAAVFSSLAEGANLSLRQMLESSRTTASSTERRFLLELCRQIGGRGNGEELATLAEEVARLHDAHPDFAGDLLVEALRGSGSKRTVVREQLAAASLGATDRMLATVLSKALEMALSDEVPADVRSTAIGMLAFGELDQSKDALSELLAPYQPQEVQSAALTVLGDLQTDEATQLAIAAWPAMSPALRKQAASVLLARAASANLLLNAIAEGVISPRDLDPTTLQSFKAHPDVAIRQRAAKLLQDGAPKRAEVVEAYMDVLKLSGDISRGREVFKKNCAVCHRKESHGTEVGADLATVVTRTPEALLISILDPNREVDPKYLQYTVLTVDGLAKSGMIAGETATSITLKREEGVTETVPRAEIESIQSTGMTLMPEGLEKSIDKQSLADLIAYLRDQ